MTDEKQQNDEPETPREVVEEGETQGNDQAKLPGESGNEQNYGGGGGGDADSAATGDGPSGGAPADSGTSGTGGDSSATGDGPTGGAAS